VHVTSALLNSAVGKKQTQHLLIASLAIFSQSGHIWSSIWISGELIPIVSFVTCYSQRCRLLITGWVNGSVRPVKPTPQVPLEAQDGAAASHSHGPSCGECVSGWFVERVRHVSVAVSDRCDRQFTVRSPTSPAVSCWQGRCSTLAFCGNSPMWAQELLNKGKM